MTRRANTLATRILRRAPTRARATILAVASMAAVSVPASQSFAGRTYAYGQVSSGATVTGRVNYCRSGSYHGAMDLAAPCGRGMRAMIYGRRYYRYVRGSSSNTCGGHRGGGWGKYFYYTGANSYRFVQAHSNHSSSYGRSGYFSKGNVLNLVGSTGNSTGAHTHGENLHYWTKITAWINYYYYSAGRCGHHPTYSTRIGFPRNS